MRTEMRYWIRTRGDGTPWYLVRVADAGRAVDVYNIAKGRWVPSPVLADTLALLAPGSSDAEQVTANAVSSVIARLKAGSGDEVTYSQTQRSRRRVGAHGRP